MHGGRLHRHLQLRQCQRLQRHHDGPGDRQCAADGDHQVQRSVLRHGHGLGDPRPAKPAALTAPLRRGLSINATTGQINLGASTAGAYTVTYSFGNASGCNGTTTAPVTVNALPTATISYSGPFCATGTASATQTGQTGGTYSAAPAGLSINATTGQINLGASTAGAYTVTYSFGNASGCNGTTTAPVTVNALPTATISYSGPFCATGTASATQTGQTGGTYSAAPAGLSINATTGQINLGASTAGAYTVTYSFGNASGCNGTTTAPVTVNALPTAYSVTGGGTYCPSASGIAVGLSGSQKGVSYQLQLNGANVGSPVAGTGMAHPHSATRLPQGSPQ